MTEILRYSDGALAADSWRAAAGLAITLPPLLFLTMNAWITGAVLVAAVIFALFAARTALRRLTRIVVEPEGVRSETPLGTVALPWDTLTGLHLGYYSTRRDRSNGWMQMQLHGAAGQRIAIDSGLDRFEAIAELAAAMARRNGVDFTPVTVDNLLALGIDTEAKAT